MSNCLVYELQESIRCLYFIGHKTLDPSRPCPHCGRPADRSTKTEYELVANKPADFALGGLCRLSVAREISREFPEFAYDSISLQPCKLSRKMREELDRDPYVEIQMRVRIRPAISLPRFMGLEECLGCGLLIPQELAKFDPMTTSVDDPISVIGYKDQLKGGNFAWFHWKRSICTEEGKRFIEERGYSNITFQPYGVLIDRS